MKRDSFKMLEARLERDIENLRAEIDEKIQLLEYKNIRLGHLRASYLFDKEEGDQ